jgi:predicted dithiol-disulfide oxidoreductase (DUF899 family)
MEPRGAAFHITSGYSQTDATEEGAGGNLKSWMKRHDEYASASASSWHS